MAEDVPELDPVLAHECGLPFDLTREPARMRLLRLAPDDHVRGPDDAPLVVLYADFTCPRCAVAWMRLRVAGTPGHGSMPREDSAPNRLII